LILLASITGGMIPLWVRLTHRRMQFAVSFVSGVMLGVGVLHMLPHAVLDAVAADPRQPSKTVMTTMWWLLVGVMTMFFIERFFCYHHHEVPDDFAAELADIDAHAHEHSPGCSHEHGHAASDHVHDLSWSGAALGLAIHSLLNGVALAASVQHGGDPGTWLVGLGTFLVIFLHKPFDAMTIGMLMARGGWSLAWRHTVNALFALAIPAGVLVFYYGLMPPEGSPDASSARLISAYAMSFSAGTFLCISLSDLLPELQFHHHDRGKLSAALALGLAVAVAVAQMESVAHGPHSHVNQTVPTTSPMN
jgi:zinc and cadmium transporter